ncbi:MAG: 50S ribosomal protein L3 [Myxococcales bacterium]
MMLGLLGKKLGMTQTFNEAGNAIPVTVVEAGPCVVLQKRTPEKEGYAAVRVGFGEIGSKTTAPETRNRRIGKAQATFFQKVGSSPKRWVREFRLTPEELAKLNVGDQIKADLFQKGALVDVSGITKGRGFAGVFKRHMMAGHVQTHGTHEFRRHPGAVGQRKTPGKVWKNKRMPGHYGVERVTVQNLEVVEVVGERNLLLIKGALPGANGGLLIVRPAVKPHRA